MTSKRRSRPDSRPPRISGPGELLQAVPYLLGFHPTRSLVLIGLDDGLLAVTARIDLSDAATEVLAQTVGAMVRGGTTSLVAVVYDDEALPEAGERLPWERLVALIELTTEDRGCEALDVLLVARGRWWSLTCDARDCCPDDGRELPSEPSPFAAAAAYDGIVAMPDRAALQAVLAPLPQTERKRLDGAIEAAEHASVQATLDGHAARYRRSLTRALFAAARESEVTRWVAPPDDDIARFGVALSGNDLRNAVWMAIDDARIDGRPLWRELGRRLPTPYDATPLFLFGWASWRAGDGTLAGMAAERVVASVPGYSAADLLLAALANGVDPRQMPKLRLGRSA